MNKKRFDQPYLQSAVCYRPFPPVAPYYKDYIQNQTEQQDVTFICLLPLHQPERSGWDPCNKYDCRFPTSPGYTGNAWRFQHSRRSCLPYQDGPLQLKKGNFLQQLQVKTEINKTCKAHNISRCSAISINHFSVAVGTNTST